MPPRNNKEKRSCSKDSLSRDQENMTGDPDDYRKRRERNNEAVKKSRVKSKLRTQQTMERVHKLKMENEMLQEKIKVLTKELEFLKELFFAHTGKAHGDASGIDEAQINLLIKATQVHHTEGSSSSGDKRNCEEKRNMHRR